MFKEQAMETLILIAALSISMVMPLQSDRMLSEECSTGVLEQARRAFRADDLSQAEKLAESIVGCPEALGREAAQVLTAVASRRENDRLWQRAQVLIQKERFEEACQLLHGIHGSAPDFPNLQVANQRAGCDPDLRQLQRELDRVAELVERENWQEARQLVDGGAFGKALKALSLQSSGPLLIERQDSIERERQMTLLRLSVRSYYSGRYAETIAQLKGYLEENPQPPFASFAYFYLGASLASSSLLSANAPTRSLDTAREHFRTGRHIDPDFKPPLESVSPRIQALFSQAVVENR